ncbi:MAG: VWA domain-containing protein, partial [Pirellulales bacterium]
MLDGHFANPNWFHALWAVWAVVVALLWLDRRGRAALDRLLSPTMQRRLARRLPRGRRWLSMALLGLAGVAFVVAMMRPQGAPTYRRMPRVGAQMMVCLDVSKSMLAEDSAPNRLERAKAELTDLLPYLEGDQVGLIAFAGKAAVLCPLTPDFGFFKLILDGAGPHSVGRGGTRLEEPIRKALAGFRTESDISRVILLVTDGEDHDSYPLQAAEEAAERGIKMIAIGFGDEAGSEVQITDPETGIRSSLKDREGRPVITRLDGEMLREIAMATDGVYVPAGTGALDLESIYQSHIAPLTRDTLEERGFSVRREYFQWAILAGLALFIASLAAASGAAIEQPQRASGTGHAARRVATVLLVVTAACHVCDLGGGAANRVWAQPPPPARPDDDMPAEENQTDRAASDKKTAKKKLPKSEPEETDPRKTYNEALACLDSDLDRSERLLTDARRHSETDAEVRFCATYNMGWVDVRRADSQLKEDPEQALLHLRSAADWFRDAVRLRPDHVDSRHNLEVILRRIVELADSLREQEDQDLAQRLDALIESQRAMVGQAGEMVEAVTDQDDSYATDRFRLEYRRLAVQQRQILSDSQTLANSAGEELDSLEKKKDEERQPEEAMRSVQLNHLLHYLNRANQRLGMARSQLRRKQGERAFRRAATALDELKRARDQLRNPVEILGVLVGDAAQLAGLTNERATGRRSIPLVQPTGRDTRAWLTDGYLGDSQQSITERTNELAAQLDEAIQGAGQQAAGPPTPERQQPQASSERRIQQVREATPFVHQAASAFQNASTILGPDREDEPAGELSAQQLDDVGRYQIQAIQALLQARERFLDIKGLIELAHGDETRIQAILAPPGEASDTSRDPRGEAARQLQDKNVDRGLRLSSLLDEAIAELPPAAESADANPPDREAAATGAERKRLDLAKLYLAGAQVEMTSASEELGALLTNAPSDSAPADSPPADPPPADPARASQPEDDRLGGAKGCVDRAVDHLSSLRRL